MCDIGARRMTPAIEQQLVRRYLPDPERTAAARHLRSKLAAHPRAAAFARSAARKRAVCANRRAAKTSTCGSELGARLVERDDYSVWVLAADLSEFGRNWLQRRPHGLIQLLQEAGLRKGTSAQVEAGRADFAASKGPQGFVRRVEFRWGSVMEIFSDEDGPRGSAPHVFYVDEAQKVNAIVEALLKVLAPAGSDHEMEIWLSFTPGHEIDTLAGQVAMGQIRGWDVHVFHSWDNPYFGATWRERYENHVLDVVLTHRDEYGVTDEQMAYLESLDEAGALAVEEHLVGKTLPDDVLRELFGRWIRSAAGMVFALGAAPEALWGPEVDGISHVAHGDGRLDDFLAAPAAWPPLMALLPRAVKLGRDRAKPWRAILSADLGHYPDPFALVAQLWSPEDTALYELDSCKALHLGEDHQRDALLAWAEGLRGLGVELSAVVVDSGGGGSASIKDSWHRLLVQRFGVPVHAAEKHATTVERQIWLMNVDIRSGRYRVRRGSPLAIEMRHLQWRLTDAGKRVIDDKRMVALPDGTRSVLGDHCCDGARYGWYFGGQIDGRPRDTQARPSIEEQMEQRMEARLLRKPRRARGRR